LKSILHLSSLLAIILLSLSPPLNVEAQRANVIPVGTEQANLTVRDPLICGVCCVSICPTNYWSPYGPFPTLHHVRLQYYSDPNSELNAFLTGGPNGLDITDLVNDGLVPPYSTWPGYDANPDFNLSPAQGSGDWQGLYFNGASSTWQAWGCNWQYYNSACGIEMRQAFAHLIDRPNFDKSYYGGTNGASPVWDDVPGNKVFPDHNPFEGGSCPTMPNTAVLGCIFESPASNFCSWDTIDNSGCTSSTGPYLVNSTISPNGFPAIPSGPIPSCPASNTNPAAWSNCNNDFALAAEHMVMAGIATGMDPKTYQIGNFLTRVAGIQAHPLRDCVRTSQPRLAMGDGWDAALNNLFGAGGASAYSGAGAVAGPVSAIIHGDIVFCGFDRAFTEISSPVDDWDMYTYGYSNPTPFPSYLYTQFSTAFSFNGIDGTGLGPTWCGGTAGSDVDQPTNPTFTCLDGRTGPGISTPLLGCVFLCTTRNNQVDTPLLSAQSTSLTSTYENLIALNHGSALDVLGQDVASIPVHSLNFRTPALTAVAGLTNTLTLGYSSDAVFLLAHDNTGYTPLDPKYAFDGGLSTDTIRWGQSSTINSLNPYNAETVQEFQTLGLVYDSLFLPNPTSPSEIYCEMCQTYSIALVNGNTQISVELRQNLEFQDGTRINARDIAFSYLTLRDQSIVLSGALPPFKGVILSGTDPLSLILTENGQSVSTLINLSGVPIMPINRWACPPGVNGASCTPDKYTAPGFYTTTNGLQGSPPGTTLPSVDFSKGGPLSPGYDPIVDNNFIGSGPFMCADNLFGTTPTHVGGGCTTSGIGQTESGGNIELTNYNRVAPGPLQLNDPFAQYVHSDDPNWSKYPTTPGHTAVAESGQQQEFSWASNSTNALHDAQEVSLLDVVELKNNCNGATSATTACPDYQYWLRSNLHPSTPGTISTEVAVVQSHYLDAGVGPFTWNGQPAGGFGSGTLDNIIAYPGNCAPDGSSCPP
jgi:ABC-type transport system substrate-binding protein